MGRARPPERPKATNSLRLGTRALLDFAASVLQTLANANAASAKLALWLALWLVGALRIRQPTPQRVEAIAALETALLEASRQSAAQSREQIAG